MKLRYDDSSGIFPNFRVLSRASTDTERARSIAALPPTSLQATERRVNVSVKRTSHLVAGHFVASMPLGYH
jgi:hypothetical protein